MLDLNWLKIEPLPTLESGEFLLENVMPAENSNREEFVIGRTEELEIPFGQWGQIKDAQVAESYAKKAFVKSYFTTAIYYLKRVRTLSLVAGKTYRETVDISHTSSYRNTTTTGVRIENTVEATNTDEFGSLRDTLTTTYSIDKMEEYYNESRTTNTKEVYYESAPYERDIVFLDLVKIVALYRKDKKGNVKLIAFNDFLLGTYEKAYRSPSNQD